MIKIELEVLGLSYSQTQSGAYALVLTEKDGNRRIPIIIGAPEAQSIAIQIEGLTPIRPLTHDLFISILTQFAITIVEVNISKLVEGVFYSDLICERAGQKIKVDARTSDAVALALRFRCPIYTYEDILENAGIVIDKDKTFKKKPKENGDYTTKSLDILEKLLEKAIEREEYEKASKIRDEINKRNKV